MQGRDPFSGDCDATLGRSSRARATTLAGTRPVFRGLRHVEKDPVHFSPPIPMICLQGRDPFSGDCDPPRRGSKVATLRSLQGRDPFSGDCDSDMSVGSSEGTCSPCKDETRFQGIATAFMAYVMQPLTRTLAGTRSVFRGLRRERDRPRPAPQGGAHLQGRDPFSGDCDVGATRRVALMF